jgi:myo-inositol 2-dehydrogenase/D-chiro-inositol 1-dehydrogenase
VGFRERGRGWRCYDRPGTFHEEGAPDAVELLRLGVLGTGFIGQQHARNAAASDAVELVALASLHGDAAGPLAAELRCAPASPSELLAANDIDAIVVASRTGDHASHAVAVLERGKHLLVEKPGAISTTDHALISAAAARRPDLTVRVAYHRRHDARFRELARRVAAGDVGEPFAVHMRSSEDYPPSDADRSAGGFVMDVGVHDFDTARWLLRQDPTSVYAVGRATRYEDADNFWITVSFAAGVATTELSRTSPHGMDIRCEVVGSEGSALLCAAPLERGLTLLGAADKNSFPRDCLEAFADAYRCELADFAASCRGQEAPGATLDDDAHAVATAVAARASALRGTPLAVGPDWDWPAG